jgi:hypothetical protein
MSGLSSQWGEDELHSLKKRKTEQELTHYSKTNSPNYILEDKTECKEVKLTKF